MPEPETAVETAVEVKEPPPPDITQLCRDAFHKTADYLTGELECKDLVLYCIVLQIGLICSFDQNMYSM